MVFAGGNLIATGLRLVGSLVLYRVVSPATLGAFQGLTLPQSYISPLHLGVPDGLTRELPLALGRGDRLRAEMLAAAAGWWVGAVSAVACAAGLCLAVVFACRGDTQAAVAWVVNSVAFVSILYGGGYLQATFRTSSEFRALATKAVLEALILLAGVLLVWALDFFGLAGRALLAAAFSLAYLWMNRPFRVRPRWSRSLLLQMWRVGFPILVNNAVLVWWAALDRTLVLTWLGTRELGLYSVALLTSSTIAQFPQAFAQVAYPSLAFDYAGAGEPGDVIRGAWRSCLVPFLVSTAIAAVAWPALPYVLQIIAPQYMEALAATRWAAISSIPLSFSPARVALYVLGKPWRSLVASVVGVGTYGAALALLGEQSLSLADFPKALLVGQSATVAVTAGLHWLELRRTDRG
ncbi:MAG: lipopolysaccharide biosynthesis protein [Actinomycetia bacterium]|nr:lipopolysaccharide biosynthesis protein [Actinomycetes bacterium]